MKLSVNDLSKVIQEYMISVLIPKVSDPKIRFGLSFASGYISSSFINNWIATNGKLLVALGIIDNGFIDIELAKSNAMKALKDCSNSIEIMNYRADSEDVDILYNIAKKYSH